MMNKTKRVRGMSATELAEATKEYDLEGAEPKFLSAPPELRAAERRISKRRVTQRDASPATSSEEQEPKP
jgi:hypothetical protein